ncbi:xanthine dehydrogenase accessory protein XdhC [Thauera butanivorans]|uniref:xanthine dehydrogenase accessory protein XdhC n=1 Tax=Thauera butanivorans TaxID=86174 RepID=UPI0008385801|nr:xanthine dehydrogenase accessory protein XdhC [Thauera butanivorans]
MTPWIEQLARWVVDGVPAVLVTVAATRGSTPRAPGARMIVSTDACHGTIGGGQLELRAITLARQLLADGAALPGLVRFPLGASVGQCCGGVMQLAFEPVGAAQRGWIEVAQARAAAGRPWGRLASLTDSTVRVFDEEPAELPGDERLAEHARSLLAGSADSATLLAGKTVGSIDALLDVSLPPELQVVLFGAGHVGRALAEVFGRLPMRVRWVDSRDEEFPAAVADNIEVRCTDMPEAEVRAAPADAVFLVLTHSHALDFELVRAILDRGDFRFCGLIGSHAKRASFEQRLRARGYGEQAIARLHCPIGAPGLAGKEPEVIAVAIAAEVLQLRGASLAARPAQRHRAA